MKFYTNQLFHIYNQGNNRRQIFFTEDNYNFFLWKMRAYLLPFGDIVAWCLMPNHFHWQFYVKHVEIGRKLFFKQVDEIEWQRRKSIYGNNAQVVKRDWTRFCSQKEIIDLNESIGILQRSYSLAINKSRAWTGSLFKQPCRAKDGWIDEFVTVTNNGKETFRFLAENNYGYQCFRYIHDNPVKAKIVNKAIEYRWSSAMDYAGLRNGDLCNLELGRKLQDYF